MGDPLFRVVSKRGSSSTGTVSGEQLHVLTK